MSTEQRFDWRLFARGLAIAVVAGLGTLALSVDWYGGDTQAHVGWPSTLNWGGETAIPVSVTDGDGAPLGGASIEVGYTRTPDGERRAIAETFAEGFTAVGSAQTNADGEAWVSVPPVSSLDDAPAGEAELDELTILLRVQRGLGRSTSYQTLPVAEPVRMTLSTDRPLYRPGQAVRMRGLVLESDGGGPWEPATTDQGAAADLEVEGPRGHVLYREHPLVSQRGVVDATFHLADEVQSGTYTARMSVAGSQVTREIEVRPYEKPRFELDLQAGLEAGGDRRHVRGTLRAHYVYGEPVAEGRAEVRLEPFGGPDREGETLEGGLDEAGEFAFRESLPPASGTGEWGYELTATVEDPSGRTRQTETRVQVDDARGFDVEVLPTERSRFREGDAAEGLVVVRDRRGEPLEGAQIRVHRATEESPVVAGDLETDAEGRARFEWDSPPRLYQHDLDYEFRLRIEGTTADGRPIEATASVVLAKYDHVLVEPTDPMPRVSEALGFALDLPEGDHQLGASVPVAALNDGRPVATTTVSAPPAANDGDSPPGGRLELPASARGLTYLVAFDTMGNPAGWSAIWVRQKRGDTLGIDVAGTDHRPGEVANVSLRYPAGDAEGAEPAAETTFGLRAVDEALDALVERTDLPIDLLARQPADAAEAAARAAETLDGTDADDAPTLASARLNRAVDAPDFEYASRPHSSDQKLDERLQTNLSIAWVILLICLVLALFVDATRLLWRHVDFGEFRLHQYAGMAAISLVGAVGCFLLLQAYPEVVAAVLIAVEAGAVGACLLTGVLNTSKLPYGRWLGTFVLIAGLAALSIFAYQYIPHGSTAFDVLGYTSLVLYALVFFALLVELAIWALVFYRHRGYVAATASLLVAVLIPFVALAALFASAPEPEPKFQRATASVDEMVDYGGSGGEAPGAAGPSVGDSEADGPAREDAGEDGEEPSVREAFPDTAIWRPEIVGDDGHAEVDLELPDSITTWRLHGVAHTDDGAVAGGQAALEVDRPFFVELDLPGRLHRGDELAVPVALVDGRDEPEAALEVALEVETSGGLAASVDTQRVRLPAGGRSVARVELAAEAIGDGELTVRAEPVGEAGGKGLEGDAVRRSTHVAPNGRRIREVASAIVGGEWQQEVEIPEAAIAGTATGRLRILPDRLGVALDGVGAMLDRPHGCFEQTTSAAFPNAIILQALERVGPEAWSEGREAWQELRSRARRLVDEGYQKIVRFQTDDGGFGPYAGQSAELTTTAYGLLQVGTMASALESLEARSTIRRAAAWLADHQQPDGRWDTRELTEMEATALAVWALGAAPEADQPEALSDGARALKDLTDLQGNRPLEKALAANALVAAGEPDRADILLDELAAEAQGDDERRYLEAEMEGWTGERGDEADTLVTALATRAMALRETHPKLRARMANHLASRRDEGGGWATTQTTVWAIEAFSELEDAGDEPVRLEVAADDEPMARSGADTDGHLRVIPGRTVPTDFGPRALESGSHTFSVAAEQPTDALAEATTEYVVPWHTDEARSPDAALEVDLQIGGGRLEAGERVAATATIANDSESEVGATLARLPIPPGAWADAGGLEAMVEEGALDRLERTPTHLVAYLPGLEAGESVELAYEIVPQIPGRFRLPPAIAYPYYNPRPRSVTPGGTMRVGD